MNPSKQHTQLKLTFNSTRLGKILCSFILFAILAISDSLAQNDLSFSYQQRSLVQNNSEAILKPSGALLRSFVLPGWGHYYIDNNSWRRGQLHLGTDIVLISTWVYLHTNSNILQGNINTFANAYAGINLRGVNRRVEIAVGNYQSLADYNEAQLRARNWDRLIEDSPQNQWFWESEDKRLEYVLMRDRRERATQQIPAVVSLMVLNRVVSGVHAFVQARNFNANLPELTFNIPVESGGNGFITTLSFRF